MTLITLDAVVRNFLLKRHYPLQYYLECLVAARNCLLELTLDDLKVTNTVLLPINDYNAADLPSDYVDFVRVGVRAGQNIKPLVESDKINSRLNYDSSFMPQRYDETNTDSNNNPIVYGFNSSSYYRTVTWNEYGEMTGRLFGLGAGVQDDVFKIVPERNQIQVAEYLYLTEIVLEYISDGMNADAATKITPYAFDTISQYIYWQQCENNRTYSMGEKERARQIYLNAREILRARLSDLTIEKFKRIIQRASYGSPKG